MTHFLVSDTNPDGSKLEDILRVIRNDILIRCTKISDDMRPEAQQVLQNNVKILDQISQSIVLAENSTQILDKAFGPGTEDGSPRIGSE
ncbi:MAG: histidine kinase [Rhodospirillales bacterium]|nr:histidine kinase [Alphaproteobacteria bacterium]MBL6948745.1 histidine kinase [Rhodospirillales bacterium]